MNLITDRTRTDVLLRTQKGNYGVADLNRVESAVAELVVLANGMGVDVDLEVKGDWSFQPAFSWRSWPAETQLSRYISNVRELCSAVEVAADLPERMWGLTYVGANQIELALTAVYDRIKNILQIIQYSGEIYAGEESGL